MHKTCGDSARRGDAAARRRDGPGCKGRCRTRDPGDGLGGPDVNHVFGRGRKRQLRTEQDDLLVWPRRLSGATRAPSISHSPRHVRPVRRYHPPRAGVHLHNPGLSTVDRPRESCLGAATADLGHPWGFLRGAAARNATVRSRKIDGVNYNVVTWSPEQSAPRVSRIGSWVTSMTATRSNESRPG